MIFYEKRISMEIISAHYTHELYLEFFLFIFDNNFQFLEFILGRKLGVELSSSINTGIEVPL
jgi:hypothetical protein